MKFLLKVTSGTDVLHGIGLVVLEIDQKQRKQLLRRRAAFFATKAYEKEAYCATYWDSLPDWFESHDKNVEDLFDHADRSDDPHFINSVERERTSTECAQMVVTETGVHWRSIVKYTSVQVETAELPWEVFLPIPA